MRRDLQRVGGLEGVDPRLADLLNERGIASVAALRFSNSDLLRPDGLLNIDLAAEVISNHVERGSRIVIAGDYDADGATSAALSILALRAMGARSVGFVVPDRFKFGYGLSPALVDLSLAQKPDLLITVDNGIASVEGVAHARQLGIDVVVTDHHLPGDSLPAANAIVNPNLPDDGFSSKNLAGVGVVFYVLSRVRKHLESRSWFNKPGRKAPAMAEYLDLVALGTYADLVRLDANNRILVAQGLKRINSARCRPGIRALIEVSGKQCGELVAADLGFQLAPRLNAAGRLEDMSLGIECLLTDDPGEARQMAQRLNEINQLRKEIETDMNQEASRVVHQIGKGLQGGLNGICLSDADWHEGLVGLVASRLKERLSLPVVVFAPGEEGLKGSARSVRGVHIRDILCTIDAAEPGLIKRFGGHAMAAGLSIDTADFERFRAAWHNALDNCRQEIEAANTIYTDGALGDGVDDLEFIRQIKHTAPWGQGFPEPVFDDEFNVLDQRLVGEVHLKMTLRACGGYRDIEAICFRYLSAPGAPCPRLERIHAAYRLDINDFAGRVSPQLLIEYLEPVDQFESS